MQAVFSLHPFEKKYPISIDAIRGVHHPIEACMRLLHFIFTLLMLGFAALQWNDPDRIIWISFYLTTALMAMLAITNTCKPCLRAWAMILSVITVIMMTQVFPGVVTFIQTSNYREIFAAMNDEQPYIEQSREFLGLFIVLFYCIYVACVSYQK